MPWQQIQFKAAAGDCDELEQVLLQCGALSVTLTDAEDQAVFQEEPGSTPLWDTTVLSGLFADEHNMDEVKGQLSGIGCVTDMRIVHLRDQHWETAWMANFRPLKFGKRLWICPRWLTPPDTGAINIMLDPGLAFGTGTHPTTALCLEWLEGLDLEGNMLLDFGCGSGVLGIAAVLLGAKKVWAVDNDPQALTATTANRDGNGIGEQQLTSLAPDAFGETAVVADILVANILAEPLKQLAPLFAQRVKAKGKLALSGLLTEQADSLVDIYATWFELEAPVVREGWVRISGTRRYIG